MGRNEDAERELLASYPGAIVVVDDVGAIAYVSADACTLLGWDGTLVGRPLTTIIPGRLHDRHRAGFSRYVDTGRSNLVGQTVRVPARRRDGSEVDVDLTIRVFRRPDGSKLVSAALHAAPLGKAPPGLVVLEDALQ
ncbi:MAG TPA: PAS domain S-box protein, partial [Candidatus Thermoplasmatota archaeon]|nr:PAS domain S-box protein [Candidatus Thermoplasmatota archaeon]